MAEKMATHAEIKRCSSVFNCDSRQTYFYGLDYHLLHAAVFTHMSDDTCSAVIRK